MIVWQSEIGKIEVGEVEVSATLLIAAGLRLLSVALCPDGHDGRLHPLDRIGE
jgi:hypothetical protein